MCRRCQRCAQISTWQVVSTNESSCFIGNLRSLNDLAKQANAQHIIHTGDFGFYDETSLERIAEK